MLSYMLIENYITQTRMMTFSCFDFKNLHTLNQVYNQDLKVVHGRIIPQISYPNYPNTYYIKLKILSL